MSMHGDYCAWEWRAKHPQTGEVVGPWIPCGSAKAAERARACGYEVRAKQTFSDGFEQALHDAYAEGRKDEADERAWQPIDTAPEDENILVATQGGYVDTAFWTDDGDGRKWWWLESANKYAPHPIHPNLVPTHWMPLPKHPGAAQ